MRSFVAIELAPELRDAAAEVANALRERLRGPRVGSLRWVRPEALHVTLRFLGNVESSRTAEIAHAIGVAVAEEAPFTLSLGPVIGLPGERRPRVVALAVEPAETLAALADAVERGVRATGLPGEKRRFRGHLTLARVREGRVPLPDARVPRASMPVREVVLFRSELTSQGPHYTPLERLALGGNDHPESRTIPTNDQQRNRESG